MSGIINNRYDFVVLFDVENGNPNGDPDMGNMPRIDPQTGQGIVTDVCLKRKIRDYVDIVYGNKDRYNIYVRSGTVLNDQHVNAYNTLGIPLKAAAKSKVKKTNDNDSEVTDAVETSKENVNKQQKSALVEFMCNRFFDVRTFGAVMDTGEKCGQVRGPIQLSFSRSIDAIYQQEITITRCAATNETENGVNQTMGKKFIVPYGLYRLDGFISANFAKKTGFTEDDLNVFFDALVNMFEHDHSAARGKMSVRKVFVFKHASVLGNCQAYKLFDLISVTRNDLDMPARKFNDYTVRVLEGLPEKVEMIEMV